MADKRISQLVDRGTVVNSDVVPIVVSGAVTTNKATISSIQTFMQGNLDLGVTSVGITLGSSGTDVSVSGSPITSSGNITINLPTASATNRGLLSAADWSTFNSKQGAITLTTTGTSGASTLVGNTLNIPNYTTDLSGYVTLGTAQTITAQKTFTTSGSSDTMIISHGSGSGFALDVIKAGNGEAIRVTKTSGSGNAMTISGGNFEAGTIVKTGGTSSQFLKADGSVDSSTYLTTGTASSTYVPYTGAAANVDLGVYNLTASAVNVNGSGSNAGVINLESNAIFPLVNGYGTIGSGTTNQFNFYQTTGAGVFRGAILSLNSITASATRTFTLPDASGTLALTSDISTAVAGYLPLTGGTLSNNLFIAGGGLQVSGSTSANRQVVELYTSGSVSRLAASYVGASSYGSLELLTSGLARLTIADTGTATFSTTENQGGVYVTSATDNTTLRISSTAANGQEWRLQSTGGSSGLGAGKLIFKVGGTETASHIPLTLTTDNSTNGGRVGIGTTSPIAQLQLGNFSNSFADIQLASTTAGYSSILFGDGATGVDSYRGYIQYQHNGDYMILATASAERMRITSGGYLKASNTGGYINSTGAFHEFNSDQGSNFSLYVKNSSASAEGIVTQLNSSSSTITFFGGYSTSDSAYKFLARTNGDVKNATGVYGTISSDIRLKENILDATSKLKDIMKLRVVNFNLLGKEEKHIGFIAQEMQEVFPSLVDQNDTRQYDEDGNLISGLEDALGVKVGMEFAILVKVIQELKTEIDSLKNQIK